MKKTAFTKLYEEYGANVTQKSIGELKSQRQAMLQPTEDEFSSVSPA